MVGNNFEQLQKVLFCILWNFVCNAYEIPKDANIYASAYQHYLPDKALLQAKVKEWIEEFEENETLS